MIILTCLGSLTLPWMFDDHMVLQRQTPVPIWGSCEPHATVTAEFAGQSVSTKADSAGNWILTLAPMTANNVGQSLTLNTNDTTKIISDVLVGDVWLCAGQSNMDFAVRSSVHQANDLTPLTEVRLCDRAPQLTQTAAKDFYAGTWQHATSETILPFSAVGFFFAQDMQPSVNVPIGMIDISLGGSTTEGWLPADTFAAYPECASLLEDPFTHPLTHPWVRGLARPHYFAPSYLYEAAIEPFAPFAIKGVLWYQGESNAHLPHWADRWFRHLVDAWRTLWSQPELPFFYVQLPGMERPTWPLMRHVQSMWQDIAQVFMAVSIDVGHPTDVHPNNKKPVGQRLSLLARNNLLLEDVECYGPTLAKHFRKDNELWLEFDHAEGLVDQTGAIGAFELAGADRRFYPAHVTVHGNQLRLSSKQVDTPIDARYAHSAYPQTGLSNLQGLPAAPFRTYSWRPTRIACIGDSITAGAGLANPQQQSYPAVLQAMLGAGFDVQNFGRSGCCVIESTLRGTWQRAYSKNIEHGSATLFQPDIVICNLGINDVMEWDSKKKAFEKDYGTLLKHYKGLDSKPKILIASPLSPLFP
ncbi:MAG: GDSL-type esterase/lipase family protein, partial [Planctomycetota bacterium]|nr:GDSL-type esterase/lipase family protein [Planctomycetota bacterium]